MSTQYILEPPTSGKVILHTSVGDIEIELWTKEAPLTCRNFIQLCLEGYYDNVTFHRLVKDFMVQGGDPTGTGKGGESIYGRPFKDEFHQRLRFNRRALVGMANAGTKDSNGSQFFITLATEPTRELDRKHTLFGKITGPTVFNMLRLGEGDVDANEKPMTLQKIVKTTVITNPFDDLIIREKEKKKKKSKEDSKTKIVPERKLNLLSFGDEAEEDEEEIAKIHKKLSEKPKSAHDALEDAKLSKQVAVTRDEMADYDRAERVDDPDELDRIRTKLGKKRKIVGREDEGAEKKEKGEEEHHDLQEMIDTERQQRQKEEVDRKAAEVKAVQKEYMKALRKPKEKKPVEEPESTENMKKYETMKLKFKDPSKSIVKAADPAREGQTDDLMQRFKLRLGKSNQAAILFDKKIDLGEEKKAEKKKEDEEEEQKFGVDLDAEDEEGTEWIASKFVAQDEVDPNLIRAKDANLRETSEDWYPLDDPRNPINKRRRGEM